MSLACSERFRVRLLYMPVKMMLAGSPETIAAGQAFSEMIGKVIFAAESGAAACVAMKLADKTNRPIRAEGNFIEFMLIGYRTRLLVGILLRGGFLSSLHAAFLADELFG